MGHLSPFTVTPTPGTPIFISFLNPNLLTTSRNYFSPEFLGIYHLLRTGPSWGLQMRIWDAPVRLRGWPGGGLGFRFCVLLFFLILILRKVSSRFESYFPGDYMFVNLRGSEGKLKSQPERGG